MIKVIMDSVSTYIYRVMIFDYSVIIVFGLMIFDYSVIIHYDDIVDFVFVYSEGKMGWLILLTRNRL